jgi:ribose transport system substrate-binding protein
MRQGRVRGRVGAPLAALLIVTLVAVMGIVGTASAKPVGGQKWVLGVSNTLVGNGWREEMICAVKARRSRAARSRR